MAIGVLSILTFATPYYFFDCGSSQVTCNGAGAIPPATLVEFTLVPNGQDVYDEGPALKMVFKFEKRELELMTSA
ncbi:hypothetical protein LguiB_015798 [Lonicera macranthoides]